MILDKPHSAFLRITFINAADSVWHTNSFVCFPVVRTPTNVPPQCVVGPQCGNSILFLWSKSNMLPWICVPATGDACRSSLSWLIPAGGYDLC